MSMAPAPTEVVGNPVRRDLLLRALRSNTNATILTVWTILVAAIGVIVVINQVGLSRPFETRSGAAEPVGRALAQWWIITITAGMALLAPILATVACSGHDERQRLQSWSTTLVKPGRVVTGVWQQQLALIALALVLALPVAGVALGLGGTNAAQLGVGLAGAALLGVMGSALGIAFACRSQHTIGPLALVLVLMISLFAVPFALHQVRSPTGTDPALTVVPVVAVADAAAPRVAPPPTPVGAADAPLDHLRANVTPTDSPVPPWGWAAGGAVIITLLMLGLARLRISRPPRQR